MDCCLLNFKAFSGIRGICTALPSDREPMRGSPAGTTAAKAGGRPTTDGRSSSTRNAMPDRYARTCASSARAMPRSSISKRYDGCGQGGCGDSLLVSVELHQIIEHQAKRACRVIRRLGGLRWWGMRPVDLCEAARRGAEPEHRTRLI